MGYATYDDLLANFGEREIESVTDRDRDGVSDDGVVEDGLSFADDMIDGYLRGRYSLPLAVANRNLVGIACDIARYRYYQDQPTDLVVARYEQAIDWLRDVAGDPDEVAVRDGQRKRVPTAKVAVDHVVRERETVFDDAVVRHAVAVSVRHRLDFPLAEVGEQVVVGRVAHQSVVIEITAVGRVQTITQLVWISRYQRRLSELGMACGQYGVPKAPAPTVSSVSAGANA
jgi:phage gp36-like protein